MRKLEGKTQPVHGRPILTRRNNPCKAVPGVFHYPSTALSGSEVWNVAFVAFRFSNPELMNTSSTAPAIIHHRFCSLVTASAVVAGLWLQGYPSRSSAQAPAAPAATVAPAATAAPSPASETKGDLLSVAKAAGNFQTLLKAIDAAGLTGTLQKPGPFTVFAPTDAAFAKLPAGTLESLLKPENKTQLVALLSYHVAAGKFSVADLAKLDEVKTLEGTEVDIEASSDGKSIEVDEGKIVSGGAEASNGVIHALDTVLQP